MKISELKTKLEHDGQDDDLRLFRPLDIHVFASLMDEEGYALMEKQIEETGIDRELYTVYAWNDCSGYEYWKDEDSNYIMVTVRIKGGVDVSKIDVESMEADAETVYFDLCHWDNTDEYYHQLMDKEESR